jgi:hypothetical protein
MPELPADTLRYLQEVRERGNGLVLAIDSDTRVDSNVRADAIARIKAAVLMIHDEAYGHDCLES